MSSYLQLKKRAFMSIVNGVKGFVRTVSGVPPISLEDCVDSDSLIDYKIYGDSVQNGTPTPEVPVEVVSVGEYDTETGKYKIPVTARGKNLFDKSSDKINGFATKTLDNDGNIVIDGGSGTGNYISANFVISNWECLIGKTLTISGSWIVSDLNKGAIRIQYNRNGSAVGTVFGILNNSGEVKTTSEITAPSQDGDVLCVYLYANTNGTMSQNATVTYTNIQLETGTTATAYEPYHKPITTNLFLDEPLRKVGDYADYVDFGKGEVVRKVFERELTKDYGYRVYKYTNTNFYGFLIPFIDMKVGNRQDGFCTHLNNIPKSINSPIWFGVNEYAVYMSFPDIYNSAETDAERVTAFKAYLTAQAEAGTPVKVTYILAEPTRTPISIPKLPTIKGTTIYETGTSLNASNMEATYYSTVKGE